MSEDVDPPRPKLVRTPAGGEWTFVGEAVAGDIRRLAFTAEVWRNGEWNEAQVAFVTEGCSWDPLHRGAFWHRADWCATFIREFAATITQVHESAVLGPLLHLPANELFALVNGSVYSEVEEWTALARGLGVSLPDIERSKDSIGRLERHLRVLSYVEDIPTTYLFRTPDHDRLIFRDHTTSGVHEIRLAKGETVDILTRFAEALEAIVNC